MSLTSSRIRFTALLGSGLGSGPLVGADGQIKADPDAPQPHPGDTLSSVASFQAPGGTVAFDGDAGPVCFLLDIDGYRILLDCGWTDAFDPVALSGLARVAKDVDAVIISHSDVAYLGALPYARRSLGLPEGVRLFATLPVVAMGKIAMSAALENALGASDFNLFDERHVDSTFQPNLWRSLSYCQTHLIDDPKAKGITVTPFPSGHSLGGAIWLIRKNTDAIIYAININNRRELHLSHADLTSICPKPGLVITGSHRMDTLPLKLSDRNDALLKSIAQTLDRGGNVLMPCDSTGRVIELALFLESIWEDESTELNKRGFRPVLLTPHAEHIFRLLRTMNEWVSDDDLIQRLIQGPGAAAAAGLGAKASGPSHQLRDRALAEDAESMLQYVRFCHSVEEFFEKFGTEPCVVLTGPASIECGPSRHLFSMWSGDSRNSVLLTQRACRGTLSRFLFDAMSGRPAAASGSGPTGQPTFLPAIVPLAQLPTPPDVTLTLAHREALQGSELTEAKRQARRRRARAQAADRPGKAPGGAPGDEGDPAAGGPGVPGAAPPGGLPESEDDFSDDEEDDEDDLLDEGPGGGPGAEGPGGEGLDAVGDSTHGSGPGAGDEDDDDDDVDGGFTYDLMLASRFRRARSIAAAAASLTACRALAGPAGGALAPEAFAQIARSVVDSMRHAGVAVALPAGGDAATDPLAQGGAASLVGLALRPARRQGPLMFPMDTRQLGRQQRRWRDPLAAAGQRAVGGGTGRTRAGRWTGGRATASGSGGAFGGGGGAAGTGGGGSSAAGAASSTSDMYGEPIRPSDYRRAVAHITIDGAVGDRMLMDANREALRRKQEFQRLRAERMETKVVTSSTQVHVAAFVSYVDVEGLADGQSVVQLLESVDAQRMIFINGIIPKSRWLQLQLEEEHPQVQFILPAARLADPSVQQAIEAARRPPTTDTPFVALSDPLLHLGLDLIDVSSTTRVVTVSFSDRLVRSLSPKTFDNCEFSLVRAQVNRGGFLHLEPLVETVNAQAAKRATGTDAGAHVPAGDRPGLALASTSRHVLSVGDVRMAELRVLLESEIGIRSRLEAGVLVCRAATSGRKITISRNPTTGALSMQGPLSPLYFKVRQLVYRNYVVLG
ncbi:hypothetical protein H696_02897 [Fonticula alba]|uniref:Cleavage and polyadenylation specificity factor subunit 2 n=1 Tax=Fonticula alba TaxID=691883 RepID=A0A058Z8Y8_FONAL|nr:hypothetical protein H696_02897 [Fonticula alba]KCV70551.1 hypothetical protein H696_02897 [Fonticula alba]|eukprot:XP_009495067.1 hypothetical protein H696_02897 [Fonticula alba]